MHRFLLVVFVLGLACSGPGAEAPPTPEPAVAPAPAEPAPAGKRKARGRKGEGGAGAVAPVAASTGTPGGGTLVNEIYALYAPDAVPPALSELGCFTRALQPLIVAAEEPNAEGVPALDYDPVLAGDQDWQIAHLHLTTTGKGSSAVTVTATFDNFGQPRTVTYDVVEEGGNWRIANIRDAKNDLKAAVGAR